MIIFDLDGTLADCEHRRHFVDRFRDQSHKGYIQQRTCDCECPHSSDPWFHKDTGKKWQPDWDAFHEACDQDKPIYPVWDSFNHIRHWHEDYAIWSGRSESVRKKTINWLMNRCPLRPTYWNEDSWNYILKMRPIGDYTPDDQLKERWLNERCSDLIEAKIEGLNPSKHDIDCAFDANPNSIKMWRRRGIFVFNTCQHDEEF